MVLSINGLGKVGATALLPLTFAALALGQDDDKLSGWVDDIAWVVPACRPSSERREPKAYYLTAPMRFVIPRGRRVIRSSDVDYETIRIVQDFGKKKYYLYSTFGLHATSLWPSVSLSENLPPSRKRRWESGGYGGLDTRGKLRDGTHWRHVSYNGMQSAGYKGFPAEVREKFDAILDSMCVLRPE